MSNLKDRIWVTSRSRVFSENRYRLYDLTSHLFLTYMALLMIIASVFSKELGLVVRHFEKITILLALFLFTTSLVIYGFRFSEMAGKHRDCYLKLQGLELNFDGLSDPSTLYQEILSCYPNHAQRDYENFIIDRTLFKAAKLTVDKEAISWTKWMLLKKVVRIAAFWFLVLAPPFSITYLFSSPFLAGPSGIQ